MFFVPSFLRKCKRPWYCWKEAFFSFPDYWSESCVLHGAIIRFFMKKMGAKEPLLMEQGEEFVLRLYRK